MLVIIGACWKMVLTVAGYRVATNVQFVKSTIAAKCNRAKCNKTSCTCIAPLFQVRKLGP